MRTVEVIRTLLLEGRVIPAHPLVLTPERRLDEQRQRALSRYYLDAGAGGLAVGVHTTQFAIHEESVGLYQPVLELAGETIREYEQRTGTRIVKVAGLIGRTDQAVHEARLALDLGYDCGLLSLNGFPSEDNTTVIEHCRRVGEVIPLFGFYLQPAVGGRVLDFEFWRNFTELDSVVAIKIAPFNRYRTLDVLRAVADSGCADRIALYTGNDDAILFDLLSTYRFGNREIRCVGGLLGQWAIWTKRAVELLERIRDIHDKNMDIPRELLASAVALTDCNSAIFDAENFYAGCIPGIHEILRRQGLLEGTWCLDKNETLSPGQREKIDRVLVQYPQLNDDAFVMEHIHQWLH